MKKTIFSLLLVLCCMNLSAKDRIVERPPFNVSTQSILEIDKIVLTDQSTTLYLSAYLDKNGWVRIDSKSYIVANNKKLGLTGADNIIPDSITKLKEGDRLSFTLSFPSIDKNTKQIDFIESDCKECFKIWGIELKSKMLKNKITVPKEIVDAAVIREDNSKLTAPLFNSNIATLKGHLFGYIPDMKSQVTVTVNNPITGGSNSVNAVVTDEGNFEIKVPVVSSTQVQIKISPFYDDYMVLTPEQESSVYINLQDKYRQDSRTRIDKSENVKYIFFNGANSDLNNQTYDIHLSEYGNKLFEGNAKMPYEIVGMTSKEYKEYVLNRMNASIEGLKKMNLTQKGLEFCIQDHYFRSIYYLMQGRNILSDAYCKVNNYQPDQGKMPEGYTEPVFDADYYSFLKELGMNNPVSLYNSSYGYQVRNLLYISSGEKKSNSLDLVFQRMIDTGKLSAEEIKCVEIIKKQSIDNWSASKILKLQKALTAIIQESIDKDKLSKETLEKVEKCKSVCSKKDATAQDVTASYWGFVFNVIGTDRERYKDFQIKQQGIVSEINKADGDNFPQEKIDAFIKKYSDAINNTYQEIHKEDQEKFLAKIMGAEQGIAFDLLDAQSSSSKLEENSPLEDSEMEKVNQLKNPFFVEYITKRNTELKATLVEMKKSTAYKVHEIPDVEGDKILAEIIKPFSGKVILIDFWATWCGPCKNAMKEFEPTKEQFKGKDVVFIYLTNESSPLPTWENSIPLISGEHYRLKSSQFNYLLDKYKSGGIPSYLILDKKGNQVYFNIGFPGANVMAEKLQGQLN